MTTIDKIRAEIDKWDDSIKNAIGEYADGMRFVLRHFTFVLDTLEEPVSDAMKELDAKIAKASKTWEGVDVEEYMDEVRGREPDSEDLEEELENYYGSIPDDEDKINAARHFAEWQKKQDEKTIELTEDHAYFAGGVNEREKMMEGAVECIVIAGKDNDRWLVTYVGDYESMLKTCKTGDKVNIIILPKEDEK